MAYGNYFAIAEWADIIKLREQSAQTFPTSKVIFVSQLSVYQVHEQPLGNYLKETLDGGEVLSPNFWHPFRVPKVHKPEDMRFLENNLLHSYNQLEPETKDLLDSQNDIIEIFGLVKTAARNNNSCIVSVLEPPADDERAKRVLSPFNDSDKLPVPWGELNRIWKI